MTRVRQPAVAGIFYPDSPEELRAAVVSLLRGCSSAPEDEARPKALIVPHAGYIYSGEVAAEAYARLQAYRDSIRRVVLVGPSHRVGFRGLAVTTANVYRTPLGDVPLDVDAAARVSTLPQVQALDAAHASEHSLEVQLPFLQSVLGDFVLLPIVVGSASADEVAHVLEVLWNDDATVFVISSDLSHYLDYDRANRIDRITCSAIESLDGDRIGDEQACGRHPVRGLLVAARRHHLRPETLRLCNSGDTAGDRLRVVGYGAWAFYPEKAAA